MELKRVALDFSWPVDETWKGYINPHLDKQEQCKTCDGTGLSRTGKHLYDQWYGRVAFEPHETGSRPLTPNDAPVRTFAERNVGHAPEYYGVGSRAVLRESQRLCALFNDQWSHHLDADDVAALLDSERLMDLTHTWTKKHGWKLKVPRHIPTPAEVNAWSIIGGFGGHDSINAFTVIEAKCKRLGEPYKCAVCDGDGSHWPSKAAEQAAEQWQSTEPPKGDGYQIWETVSEGSPISPVFATPEELAHHMALHHDADLAYEGWLKFIKGPGWAPTMVLSDGVLMSGVNAVVKE